MPVIETEGLTKLYGRDRGIEDVTISVEAGEVFGFLAPTVPARRRRSGRNLPGDFGYGRESSGREAVMLLARLRGIDGLGRAEALAKRFRADLERPLGQLSRGNRQKVGLILATFHEPELLILDEPAGGLDPLMQEEFLALVAEERERGCAVFISSHDLDEVQRVCDRVGIVRNGRLIAVERMADLLGKARRKVTVRLADSSDLDELKGLAGVSEFEVDGDGIATFKVAGELDPVIKALAAHRIVDLEAVHPTLEEVFLGYYREEEA